MMTFQKSFILLSLVIVFLHDGVFGSTHDWDYITFSLGWPQTRCLEQQVTAEHKCGIPKDVNTWTIHGVWPSSSLTPHKGPENCNDSWHFNETEIKPLLGQMNILWPNLFTESAPDSFWIHEWKTHGTCATSEASMNTEYKYFKQGLALGTQYQLLGYLGDAGILPSGSKSYKLTTIRDVLKKKLGVSIETECFWDKENHQLYIGEIHICLTKDFKPIDCPSDGVLRFEVCSNKEDIYYPVIVHNN